MGMNEVNASGSADHIYKYIDTIAKNDPSFQGNKINQDKEAAQSQSIGSKTAVMNNSLTEKSAKKSQNTELQRAKDKVHVGLNAKNDKHYNAAVDGIKKYAGDYGGVPKAVAEEIKNSKAYQQDEELRKIADNSLTSTKGVKTPEVVGTDISKVHDAKTATEFIKNKGIDNVWDLCDKLTDDEFKSVQYAASELNATIMGAGRGGNLSEELGEIKNFQEAINWGECDPNKFTRLQDSKEKILNKAGPRPEVAQEKLPVTRDTILNDAFKLGNKGVMKKDNALNLQTWLSGKIGSMGGNQEKLENLNHLIFEKMNPNEQKELGRLATGVSSHSEKKQNLENFISFVDNASDNEREAYLRFPENQRSQFVGGYLDFIKNNVANVERNAYLELPDEKQRSEYVNFTRNTTKEERETYLALNPENRKNYMEAVNSNKLTASERILLSNAMLLRNPNDSDIEKDEEKRKIMRQNITDALNDTFGKFLEFMKTASPEEKSSIEEEIRKRQNSMPAGTKDPMVDQITRESVVIEHLGNLYRS